MHQLYIIMKTEHTVTCWLMRRLLFSLSKMLSPTKKNLCEEDSSESDAGSEAGLEPETDRFGFIVSNGCTAGWAVSHLCLWTVTVLFLSWALLPQPSILLFCFYFHRSNSSKMYKGWGGFKTRKRPRFLFALSRQKWKIKKLNTVKIQMLSW